jgi:plasmid replication initiation protein
MKEKGLVIQHNKIIEAKYRLSVGEQRLIKWLVSMIEPTDEDFKIYSIAVTDLSKVLGVSDNDFYKKVKIWSKNLISNTLTFKWDKEGELQVSWLSSAKYIPEKSMVELRFSPELKPFLLQLKSHFTSYELENVIKLKKIYSIRIYELLKQYQKIGNRRITLEEFRNLLMLKDGEYGSYNNFKKWVLTPAQKELEEKTDISFTWTEEKQWRNVFAIEFTIHSKQKNQPTLPQTEASEPLKSQESQGAETPVSPLAAMLMGKGIARKTAEELAQGHDENHILSMISYAESQHREGKIKNLAAFLVKAIKNEYRDNQAEQRDKQEKLKQKQASLDQQEQERQRKQKEQRKLAVDNFLSNLDKDGLSTLQAEFLEDSKDNGSMLASYRRNGMESPMVNGCFRDYIFRNRISKPPSE